MKSTITVLNIKHTLPLIIIIWHWFIPESCGILCGFFIFHITQKAFEIPEVHNNKHTSSYLSIKDFSYLSFPFWYLKRTLFYVLIHSLKLYRHKFVSTMLKFGAWYSILVSCTNGKNTAPWVITRYLPVSAQTGSMSAVKPGLKLRYGDVECGSPKWALTA